MKKCLAVFGFGLVAAATIGCDQPPEGIAGDTPQAAAPGADSDMVTLTTVAGNGRGQLAVVSQQKMTRAQHAEMLAARQSARTSPLGTGQVNGEVQVTQSAFTNTAPCWDLSTILINSGTNFSGSQTLCVKWDPFQGATPWWIGWTPRSYDPSRNFAGEFCKTNLTNVNNCDWFGSETAGVFCQGSFPTPNYTGGGGYVKMESWACIL